MSAGNNIDYDEIYKDLFVTNTESFKQDFISCTKTAADAALEIITFEADIISQLNSTDMPNQYQTTHRIPAGVVNRGRRDKQFLRSLVQAIWISNQPKMMDTKGPFTCAIPRCKNRATKFIGTPAMFTNRNPPFIVDPFCIPVCAQQPCTMMAVQWSNQLRASCGSFAKNQSSKCCNFCGKVETPATGQLKTCSRCNVAYYCSRDCQIKDWKRGHSHACKAK